MNEQNILIVRCGEVALKGMNKPYFERMLVDRIRRNLKAFKGVDIKRQEGLIFIRAEKDLDIDAIIKETAKVFGVASISKAVEAPSELNAIGDEAVKYMMNLIEEKGVQTFKVEGKLGSAGTNNSYKYNSCFLWWTQAKANASTWTWYSSENVNGNKYTFSSTTKSVDDLAVNITDTSAANKQVYACVTTASTYGTAVDKYSSVTNIRQYCAPVPSTTRPTITYSKSRLTVRENWTFSWSAGTAANSSSPIKGYEFCITKNGKEIPNLSVNSSGVITKGTSGGSKYLYWTNTSSLRVTCDPKNLGFAAKDKVVFWVRPYTRYGKNYDGERLPSGWPAHTATVEATVQNAAVIRKYDSASGKWQEGIARVYNDATKKWDEAESVKVYKDGNWVEST